MIDNKTRDSTVKEARKVLVSEKLMFGNERQIFMAKLVENADRAITLVKEGRTEATDPCNHCDGSGEHECDCGHSHDCGYCRGTGFSEDPINITDVENMNYFQVNDIVKKEIK